VAVDPKIMLVFFFSIIIFLESSAAALRLVPLATALPAKEYDVSL
jgi:hypothetical protein